MKKQPKPSAIPLIPQWRQERDGSVRAVRDAQFWRPAGRGNVECLLCYRHCTIAPGEAGWCQIRRNERGKLVIPEHGVLSGLLHTMLAYKAATMIYHPGALALSVGGVGCTARCNFCNSANIVWNPEKIGWLGNKPRGHGWSGGWFYTRAMTHPSGVIATAQEWGASELVFLENEPTLTLEYTLDCARLARRAGLGVVLFTNGFTTPAAIRKLAPYVSHVNVGIKGHLDPDFYARVMHSPGAVEHVKAAIVAWREAGVHLLLSDLVAPAHMMDDATNSAARDALMAWIVETLGPLQPIHFGGMRQPGPLRGQEDMLLPGNATDADRMRYADRINQDTAHARAQLHYAHLYEGTITLTCHACGGVLVRKRSPLRHCEPCTMQSHFCRFWKHEQHVTADSRCGHCGVAVPIKVLPATAVAAAWQRAQELTATVDFRSEGVAAGVTLDPLSGMLVG